MSNKNKSKSISNLEKELSEQGPKKAGRRTAVRTILAGGGGITAAAAAGGWTKPILNSVITPAHAQTSAVVLTFAGNVSLSPVVNNAEPKGNSVLDFFVGTAHAQTEPDLAGACVTVTVDGENVSVVIDFFSDSSITISGTLSGDTFTGSESGISVSLTINTSAELATATGTVRNSSNVFQLSLDTNAGSCSPIDPNPPIVLSGASTSDPVAGFSPTLSLALLGELNAGQNRGDRGDSLNQATGDSTHCVTVTLERDRQSVSVSVNGPDIPYYFERMAVASDSVPEANGYYYTYQATQSANFSGSTSQPVPLNTAREFDVVINGLRVAGSVDESLNSASGVLEFQQSLPRDIAIATSSSGQSVNVNVNSVSSGYGAYFATQVNGACTPGMGLRQTTRVRDTRSSVT